MQGTMAQSLSPTAKLHLIPDFLKYPESFLTYAIINIQLLKNKNHDDGLFYFCRAYNITIKQKFSTIYICCGYLFFWWQEADYNMVLWTRKGKAVIVNITFMWRFLWDRDSWNIRLIAKFCVTFHSPLFSKGHTETDGSAVVWIILQETYSTNGAVNNDIKWVWCINRNLQMHISQK